MVSFSDTSGGKLEWYLKIISLSHDLAITTQILIDYILAEIIDEFKEVLIISNNSIKFNNSDEFLSMFSSKLDSLASSYKAKEYLLADVSENPLLLVNLLP